MVLLIIRECQARWRNDQNLRRTAIGVTLILLSFAWQLQSMVFIAAFLFPLVQSLAVLAVAAGIRGTLPDSRRWRWVAAAHLASAAAILTTTNGLAVPVTLALLAYAARGSPAELASHAAVAIAGGVMFYRIVLAPGLTGASGAVAIGGPGVMLAYFAAFFAPFVTYLSVPAGVLAGTLATLPGAWLVIRVILLRLPAPRIERFAAGLILFAFGSAALAAVGRASFGVSQAAQSRYATYALVYWVALVLAGMSLASRQNSPLATWWTRAGRRLVMPATLLLLAAHVVSGAVWIAKSANVTAAGLAVRAGVPDEAWVRTLHPHTSVVFTAERLLRESGQRTLVDDAIGARWQIPAETAICEGAITQVAVDNASGPTTLRFDGWLDTSATRAVVIARSGFVVGLVRPAPLVAIPEPSRAQVVEAVRDALTERAPAGRRWFGLARLTGGSPYSVAAQSADGRTLCVLDVASAVTEARRFVDASQLDVNRAQGESP